MPGHSRRSARIVSAKMCAPPSAQVVAGDAGDDDVLEAHRADGLRDATRLVRRRPSSGRPVFTAQKPQARVQVSPRIMTVAVRCSQHSPMFGQRASSQTVLSVRPRIEPLSSW